VQQHLFVCALVPSAPSAGGALDYYNDYDQSRAELDRAFGALGMDWRWQPVTLGDFRDVIDSLVHECAGRELVVLNLCDGDEINGVPGVSVIRHLDACGVRYTGADEGFYRATTSKIDMKQAFDRAGVPTPAWTVVERGSAAVGDVFTRLGAPLIVKPAVSAGSMGITTRSVVSTVGELLEQLRLLELGYQGWDLAGGGVFVEQFVSGTEFTVLITGSVSQPEHIVVYPPVERVFHHSLPPTEQFLSFDRLWEVYERETPVGVDEYLWEYGSVDAAMTARLSEVSMAAYRSVGGMGYGRVDLRVDAATGAIKVLEVNAQCGLSEDENYTSIGAILRFGGRTFHGLIGEIVADAWVRA
jgi:D-alanine-D-alanine ligase